VVSLIYKVRGEIEGVEYDTTIEYIRAEGVIAVDHDGATALFSIEAAGEIGAILCQLSAESL
jgi:hypothetical protein